MSKSKLKALCLGVTCIITISALAYSYIEFSSWESLTAQVPHIVLARCVETPPAINQYGAHIDSSPSIVSSKIEVLAAIKSATNVQNLVVPVPALGTNILRSEFFPRQGETYLIFGTFRGDHYDAFPRENVVPLGLFFPTNTLQGKTLDGQIKVMLKWRLDHLKFELERLQEEKQRIEGGLKD